MPMVKFTYSGGIVHGRETVHWAVKGSHSDLIMELNGWLFDYMYVNQLEHKKLPPLDDWTQSHDDTSYWSIQFPLAEWTVWTRQDIVEFK